MKVLLELNLPKILPHYYKEENGFATGFVMQEGKSLNFLGKN